MKNTTLYRPVGLKEMELIAELYYKAFPPRLNWQPIFYPVLNQEYAKEIAFKWNTRDEFSGYCGIVTSFEVEEKYLNQFKIENVGGEIHNELWIPSEELENFNSHIQGEINITTAFFGNQFEESINKYLQRILNKFKNEQRK